MSRATAEACQAIDSTTGRLAGSTSIDKPTKMEVLFSDFLPKVGTQCRV